MSKSESLFASTPKRWTWCYGTAMPPVVRSVRSSSLILDSHQRHDQSAVVHPSLAEWQQFVADAEQLLGPESSSAQ